MPTYAAILTALVATTSARNINVDISDYIKERRQDSPLGPHYINAIWSRRDIESVDLGGGNQIAHTTGFALTDESGNTIWSDSAPTGYTPCQAGDGSTFTVCIHLLHVFFYLSC